MHNGGGIQSTISAAAVIRGHQYVWVDGKELPSPGTWHLPPLPTVFPDLLSRGQHHADRYVPCLTCTPALLSTRLP